MNEIKSFSELKHDFELILKDKLRRKFYIQKEIDRVETFIQTKWYTGYRTNGFKRRLLPIGNLNTKRGEFGIKTELNIDIFFSAFESYLNEREYEISHNINDYYSEYDDDDKEEKANEKYKICLNTLKQAKEFALYYIWLEELLKSDLTSISKPKTSDLTHKQKLLALNYLGLDLSKYDNTNSAKVLSKILELDYDNTRKYLSYISSGKNVVRTKSNLETVKKLFETSNLTDISSLIETDLENY
ncbi:MAG: hypothetical protein KDC47_08805 [Flavobacteriaceae bacterium]|nr:hypothetical protein [Flavobacteriaceae bacterium]